MWLAKSVYEPLPAIYIILGTSLAAFGFHAGDETVQGLAILAGVLMLIGGLVLALRRRAYRLSRSRSRYDKDV